MKRSIHEYNDQRDDDVFWEWVEPDREPVRARLFLPLVLLVLLVGLPWYLPFEVATRSLGGLPIWLWVTLGSSFLLSAVTSWAAIFWWRDDSLYTSEDPPSDEAAS